MQLKKVKTQAIHSTMRGVVPLLAFLALCHAKLSVAPPPLGRAQDSFFSGLYRVSSLMNDTHIDIAVKVKTNGWVAFGFRRSGVRGTGKSATFPLFLSSPLL